MTNRVNKSLKNVIYSFASQVAIIILNFVTRTIFIKYLGVSYLGISSLFANILTLLSLADLGLDTAMVYSLYKPIADKDNRKISSLMYFYKKIYIIIAIVVLIFGLLLVPFLDFIVDSPFELNELYIYYALYLINTVASYLLVNRTMIIVANQEIHLIKKYTMIFKIIKSILQIFVLIVLKNFLVYLTLEIIFTILTNIYGAYLANKLYPYLKEKNSLDKTEKKKIVQNVKSMFVYKLGGVILNNTDNIFISIFCSTALVGYYSNYTIIFTSVTNMLALIFSGITASVGNYNATVSKEKSEKFLYRIDFFTQWVYAVCLILLFILTNDFITILWGKEFVLSNFILIALAINFYLQGTVKSSAIYRETTDVFKYVKNIYLFTSILNIIFSIVFAKMFNSIEMKLFGIVIATAVARLLTNFWYEPKKTINCLFNKSALSFFKLRLLQFIYLILILFICIFICNILFVKVTIVNFILKGIICFVVPNAIYFIIYKKTDNFKYFQKLFLSIVKRNKNA